MNDRLALLESQFQAAEAAVDASDAVLRKRSAERLAALQVSSPKKRLAALADTTLTPFDREQLERSLEKQLSQPRSARTDAPVTRSSWGRRFMLRHRRGLMATAITVAPMALLGVKAVLRTPPHPVPIQFNRSIGIDWTLPDGSTLHESVPTGSLGLVNGRGQQIWLRKWFPFAGYGVTASLPEELFIQGAITRQPQALSAVPPRSSTN